VDEKLVTFVAGLPYISSLAWQGKLAVRQAPARERSFGRRPERRPDM